MKDGESARAINTGVPREVPQDEKRPRTLIGGNNFMYFGGLKIL